MAENTPKISVEWALWEDLSQSEALLQKLIEAIKTHTRAAMLALGISATSVTAQDAGEVQLAVNENPRPTVAEVFSGNPQTAEEMQEKITMQTAISEVSSLRQNGIAFYGPYLKQFAQLSPQDQYLVARAIYPDNAQWGPSLPEEILTLIQNLRVPNEMIEAILAEAKKNGADEEWDIPAFQEALEELRSQWNTGARTLADIFEYSPETTSQIYIVLMSLNAEQRLVDAQGRLVDAQGRLVDAQWRLVDAQGRLVDAQWRLVDTKGRLVDAQWSLVAIEHKRFNWIIPTVRCVISRNVLTRCVISRI